MSESNFAITFYLKEIWTEYVDFKSFIDIYTNIDSTENETLLRYLYKYIYNRYCNSNINYDTIDAFLRHIGITIEDDFDQYKKRDEILKAQAEITTDDIILVNQTLSNLAINNNEENTDPLNTILEYISNQQVTKQTQNKLESYLRALDAFANHYLNDFLDKLRPHFYKVFVPEAYIYY